MNNYMERHLTQGFPAIPTIELERVKNQPRDTIAIIIDGQPEGFFFGRRIATRQPLKPEVLDRSISLFERMTGMTVTQ